MANVTPEPHKKGLQTEYRIRLASLGLAALATAITVALVLLLPSFITTEVSRRSAASQLEQVASGSSTANQEVEQNKNIIAQTNDKLVAARGGQSLNPTTVVKLITDLSPAAVSVRGISLESVDVNSFSATVSGTAASRDALLTLRDQLSSEPRVSAVELPVETLAARENADFSLSFEITNSENE